MIRAEQNELMTRIGPGTPAGKLLRNYWQPVALTATAGPSHSSSVQASESESPEPSSPWASSSLMGR